MANNGTEYEVMTPGEYIEAVTGKCYITEENTRKEMEEILEENGIIAESFIIFDADKAREKFERLILVEFESVDGSGRYFRWYGIPD